MIVPAPNRDTSAPSHMVVLHGMMSPKGRLADVELVASTDPSLNSSALQYASKWKAGPDGPGCRTRRQAASARSIPFVAIRSWGPRCSIAFLFIDYVDHRPSI